MIWFNLEDYSNAFRSPNLQMIFLGTGQTLALPPLKVYISDNFRAHFPLLILIPFGQPRPNPKWDFSVGWFCTKKPSLHKICSDDIGRATGFVASVLELLKIQIIFSTNVPLPGKYGAKYAGSKTSAPLAQLLLLIFQHGGPSLISQVLGRKWRRPGVRY